MTLLGTGVTKYLVYEWGAASTNTQSGDLRPVGLANVSDVERFRSAAITGLFQTFLAEKRIGIYAYVGGEIVGHAWCTSPATSPRRVNRYFNLQAGEALIHYCHVAKEARGRGIFGDMIRELASRVTVDNPGARVLIDTQNENIASQRGITKSGFEYVETRNVIRVAGRYISSWSDRKVDC